MAQHEQTGEQTGERTGPQTGLEGGLGEQGEPGLSGHGGDLALEVARRHGVTTLFTLSGAHVFPIYDAAHRGGAVRILDVRHEQTAVFAAEATAKLTRGTGLAVLTAGPGVTNGISAVTSAWFNGSPLVVLGGRAPDARWGTGSLQELDHPPLLAPVTKLSATVHRTSDIPARVHEAFLTAGTAHRGPVFLDIALEALFGRANAEAPTSTPPPAPEPDPAALDAVLAELAAATHPVLVLGSDVWTGRAEGPARDLAETLGIPVVSNGMGRGVLPRGHELAVTRARAEALGQADLVIVVGAPLDFRLGYGAFGGSRTDSARPHTARVVHVVDSPDQLARHVRLAAGLAGDLAVVMEHLAAAWQHHPQSRPDPWRDWRVRLLDAARAAGERDRELLTSAAEPIHPARIYGDLLAQLDDDAVLIGDGGDFVSFAGKYVEPARPGCWLDPGPYGCLGGGLGAAIAARLARPAAQVVLLLGDGAAGLSLMDVDTLVRHRLPVVIVVGNNSAWGLEKHPMRALYGYDVAADLGPQTRYDEVVRALGGAGETVHAPQELAGALRRAFAAEAPYLVNVLTDSEVAYPRSTTGI